MIEYSIKELHQLLAAIQAQEHFGLTKSMYREAKTNKNTERLILDHGKLTSGLNDVVEDAIFTLKEYETKLKELKEEISKYF